MNRELPVRQHYGEYSHDVPGKLACLGASVNCLDTGVCCMGNKPEELEVRVQLKGYDIIQIPDILG